MEKILLLLSLVQRVGSVRAMRQLVPSLVVVVGLLLVLAIMVSALLVVGLVASYFILVQHGVTPHMAITTVVLASLVVMALLLLITQCYVKRICALPSSLLEQMPLTARATDVVSAFMDGFNGK